MKGKNTTLRTASPPASRPRRRPKAEQPLCWMVFMSMTSFSKRTALRWPLVLLAAVLAVGCAPAEDNPYTTNYTAVGRPSSAAAEGPSPTMGRTNATTATTLVSGLRGGECEDEEPVSSPADVSEVSWERDGPPLSGKILAASVNEESTRIMIVDLGEQTMETFTFQPSFLYSDRQYYVEDVSFTPNGGVIAVSGDDCSVYLFSDLSGEPKAFPVPVEWRYPQAFTNGDGTKMWIVGRSGPTDSDSTLVEGIHVQNGRSFTSEILEEPYFAEAVVNDKLLMASQNERLILENGLAKPLIRCNIYDLSICPELAAVSEQELIALAYYESIRLYFTGPGYKGGPEEYDYNINEIIVADLRTKEYLYTVEKPGPGSWKTIGAFRDGPMYASDSFLATFVPAGARTWSLYRITLDPASAERLVTADDRVVPSDFRQMGRWVWLSGEGRVLYADGSSVSLLDRRDGSLRPVATLPEGFAVRDFGAGGA